MKLAPYSKPLSDIDAPPRNDVYLFAGAKAWDKAQMSAIMRPTRTLCLPPGESPFSYVWPVGMCDILIFDTGQTDENLIEELTSILFKSGAVIVRYVALDGLLTVFKRTY